MYNRLWKHNSRRFGYQLVGNKQDSKIVTSTAAPVEHISLTTKKIPFEISPVCVVLSPFRQGQGLPRLEEEIKQTPHALMSKDRRKLARAHNVKTCMG